MDAPVRITLASREWERLVLCSVQFHDGMDTPEKEFGPLTEYIRGDIVKALDEALRALLMTCELQTGPEKQAIAALRVYEKSIE